MVTILLKNLQTSVEKSKNFLHMTINGCGEFITATKNIKVEESKILH